MARITAEFVTIKPCFLALGTDYTPLDTTAKVPVLEQLVKRLPTPDTALNGKSMYKEQTVKRRGNSYIGNAHREQLRQYRWEAK
jgi:hypothetical protein